MKSMKMFKKLIAIMLCLTFILVGSSAVFAADDGDIFLEINETDSNGVTNGNSADNNTSVSGSANNTSNGNIANNNTSIAGSTNNASNSTNNTNSNRSVSNTNSLANTGLAQTGGIIALILVVCGVSAIYSYKKVNDYKNL